MTHIPMSSHLEHKLMLVQIVIIQKQYASSSSTRADGVRVQSASAERSKCERITSADSFQVLQSSSFGMGLQEGGSISVGTLHGDRECSLTTLGEKKTEKHINIHLWTHVKLDTAYIRLLKMTCFMCKGLRAQSVYMVKIPPKNLSIVLLL